MTLATNNHSRPRPDESIVAQERAKIAAAREERLVRKEKAEKAYKAELTAADKAFAKTMAAARAKRVTWPDICAAAGISRQVANDLVRQA